MVSAANIEECAILKLAALPHLGYYKKEEYELIFPTMVLNNKKFWDDKAYKYLPSRMLQEIKNIKQYDSDINEGEVYSLTYDARMYFNSGALRHRMNLVLHPLMFKDVKEARDEKRYAKVSLHQTSPFDTSISLCSNERDSLRFEPTDIEVFFHDEIYMSPNNAAFIFSYSRPVVSFGFLICRKDRPHSMFSKKVMEIYWMNVITRNSPEIYSPWIKQLDISTNGLNEKKSNDQGNRLDMLKNSLEAVTAICDDLTIKFLTYLDTEITSKETNLAKCTITTESLEGFLRDVLIDEKKTDNVLTEFYKWIWLKFDQPTQPDFAKNFFEGVDNVLKMRIFVSYLIQIMKSYYDVVYYNSVVMLSPNNGPIMSEIIRRRNIYSVKGESGEPNKFSKFLKDLRKVESSDISLVENLLNLLFSNQEADSYFILNDSNKVWQSYIYERTWNFFGRIDGIHDDFGRLSFCCSPEIDPVYHCDTKEKIKILFELQNTLTEL